jgi:hypothetical protein
MDQNLNGADGYGQPPAAPLPHATVVPMGETWAAGVNPVSVSPRSRRLRWGIAGAVVLCVVVATAAGAFVLSGAAGAKSLTASVAPKDAVGFLEVRTDLPGDQHAKLADFMSHFPGFKDRSQFDNALDEMLNKLTSAVSPDLTYSSAFKPWMEGEVSIAATGLATGLPGGASGAVVIVGLKDRTAAESWLDSELSRQNLTTTSQDYAGTKLYSMGSDVPSTAYAFTDQDLLLGTVDGVKDALDTKTKGSLADNPDYQAAMNSLSGDSLARFYLDAKALAASALGSYNAGMQQLSGAGSSPIPTLGLSAAAMPEWIAGSVRAESNDMVVDVTMPRPAGSPEIGNHTSSLASALPGSTVGVFEVHSIGKLITDELAAVQAQLPAGSADSVKSVTDALAAIGGVDWLGDGVAVVTKDGSTYGGGIVAQAPDAATATTKLATITNLATLASGTLKITSRDETYKGVDITVLSIPGSGTAPVDIALAAKGNLIVAGYTDAFVKAVVDTTPSTSLASQSDYSTVMAAAGSSNEGSFYVDIPALEDQIGQAAFSADLSRWTLDYKPYFDHIGGVGYSVVDGNTVILRFVVTAK